MTHTHTKLKFKGRLKNRAETDGRTDRCYRLPSRLMQAVNNTVDRSESAGQNSPRQNSPRHDSPRHDSPRQDYYNDVFEPVGNSSFLPAHRISGSPLSSAVEYQAPSSNRLVCQLCEVCC